MDGGAPLISSSAWGRLEVAGLGTFKDAKLWPGGGREWDWQETGTHHQPGVQVADVDELIEHGAEVVVLSSGRQNALSVPPETVEALEAGGLSVHVAETGRAIDLYNRLAGTGDPVGALFHTTC